MSRNSSSSFVRSLVVAWISLSAGAVLASAVYEYGSAGASESAGDGRPGPKAVYLPVHVTHGDEMLSSRPAAALTCSDILHTKTDGTALLDYDVTVTCTAAGGPKAFRDRVAKGTAAGGPGDEITVAYGLPGATTPRMTMTLVNWKIHPGRTHADEVEVVVTGRWKELAAEVERCLASGKTADLVPFVKLSRALNGGGLEFPAAAR